jgi:hypothetical protein
LVDEGTQGRRREQGTGHLHEICEAELISRLHTSHGMTDLPSRIKCGLQDGQIAPFSYFEQELDSGGVYYHVII